jgi:8-oxo-dGTP pyrophosphatase MutT (NUDIX family)
MGSMAIPEYVASLRAKVGHDLLLLPGVCALVFDPAGRVLLHRRADTARWALIGGTQEPGEEPADAVVREVDEETGVEVSPERITGVCATSRTVLPNGHQVQYVVVAFRCRPLRGTPTVNDDESLEVGYFALDRLPDLSAGHRARIEHALADGPAFFAAAGRS